MVINTDCVNYRRFEKVLQPTQRSTMNKEELLNLYLEKLRLLSMQKLEEKNISVIETLKESIIYLEGEMQGY